MTTTEIKKKLYKQRPDAHFKYIRKCTAYYYTTIFVGEERPDEKGVPVKDTKAIQFAIPCDDMGDADFHERMPARQLNRWIIE